LAIHQGKGCPILLHIKK
jgi:hypothetical protein